MDGVGENGQVEKGEFFSGLEVTQVFGMPAH
jgi:hypothetical protein